MRNKIVLFFICLAIWCLLNWVPDWQHLVVGVPVSLLIMFLIADLFVQKKHFTSHPLRYIYFIFIYIPVFAWQCIKANFDVAYRVINPKLPITPGIIKVKTDLKTDTALTFLANSITLTPGTLTVDINREKSILYIHWIDVKSKDTEKATKMIAGRFEKILKKIFE